VERGVGDEPRDLEVQPMERRRAGIERDRRDPPAELEDAVRVIVVGVDQARRGARPLRLDRRDDIPILDPLVQLVQIEQLAGRAQGAVDRAEVTHALAEIDDRVRTRVAQRLVDDREHHSGTFA
jgi:hypothetical protein